MTSLTLSTCWYILKAKFDVNQYMQWIDNMLTNVNNYNLVIYSDQKSSILIRKYCSDRIKIVIKPIENFHNYKYKENWIKNHAKNCYLNNMVCWEVNMLWSEKINFVKETCENKYFDTEYYGWCDIGYFRDEQYMLGMLDMTKKDLKNWPSDDKMKSLDMHKIYYASVSNDDTFNEQIINGIQNRNEWGLPRIPIIPKLVFVAGGFFVTHRNNVQWWFDTYDQKLQLYFKHEYLVKDDQIIIADCVFSNIERFVLCKEQSGYFNNWFLFQRFLI